LFGYDDKDRNMTIRAPRLLAMVMATLITPFLSSITAAQDNILDRREAEIAISSVDRWRGDTARLLVEIGGIESPSGEEHARAARVAEEMRRIGLSDVRITESPNVIGRIPGRSGEAVVFVSTLDDLRTVAAHQRERGSPPEIEDDRVVGPGTNTSSTTAAMLTAARALIAAGVDPKHDLVFAGVAQEETGLNGMRDLYAEYKDTARSFIDVLGDGRRISYGALGIHWWKVIASGPPGHTLGGGLPNINRGIARAVDRILGLPQPEQHADRVTRINIAMLQSGAVFNHKPAEGWFSLDVRSLDTEIIAEIEDAVRNILDNVSEETGISFRLEPENMTPGGQIPGARESDLVKWSEYVSTRMGLSPTFSNSGSANLNIAIGAGTPAIGLGGGRGGSRGNAEEWADINAMMRSAQHVALLAIALGSGDPAPQSGQP
jgi:acetylornithine deacetylase/succinyl-diaminopimelate desuccinylase-like protein